MTTRSRSNGPLPADIRAAVQTLGIPIDHIRKDEIWARCPGHKATVGQADRHASWSVNENTGKHKCFSCGWGGTFVFLVKWMQNTDDENARSWIRKMGGIEHLRRRMTGTEYTAPEPESVTDADLFKFSRPPRWALEQKDVSAEACRQYGVLWEPETNRWIFPIRDPYTNELRGWQEKNSRVFINYPKHMEKRDCFFGSHLGFPNGKAIVVESPVDSVHIWTYFGNTYGTPLSSMGVSLSTEQMRFLVDQMDEVIFALDNDREGLKKSESLRKEYLGQLKMGFYHYGDSDAKDPGEQNDVEMEWGFDNASSSVVTRF